MGKRGRSSILGGCLLGTLGGLLGIGIGGWITYTMISAQMELPEPGAPGFEPLTLMSMHMLFLGVPVLLGAFAGGVIGFMSGSLIGSVFYFKFHATSPDTVDDTKFEPAEPRSKWVNGAIYGLIGLGSFWALLSTLMLISGDDKTLSIVFALWGLMGVASGIMLSKRAPGARALGIVFVLPGFLVFPHGTVIAPILVYALCCGETTRYLSE